MCSVEPGWWGWSCGSVCSYQHPHSRVRPTVWPGGSDDSSQQCWVVVTIRSSSHCGVETSAWRQPTNPAGSTVYPPQLVQLTSLCSRLSPFQQIQQDQLASSPVQLVQLPSCPSSLQLTGPRPIHSFSDRHSLDIWDDSTICFKRGRLRRQLSWYVQTHQISCQWQQWLSSADYWVTADSTQLCCVNTR